MPMTTSQTVSFSQIGTTWVIASVIMNFVAFILTLKSKIDLDLLQILIIRKINLCLVRRFKNNVLVFCPQ